MSFKFATSDNIYKMDVGGSAKDINIHLGDAALKPARETAVQEVMKTVGKTASKVIEGGGDLITAPVVWLKDMQQNWLMYIVAAATILLTISFLYCVVRSYFGRNRNSRSMVNLVDLASVITTNKATLQRQLPLPTSKIPSAASNIIAELSV
jgi:hypothetical protein